VIVTLIVGRTMHWASTRYLPPLDASVPPSSTSTFRLNSAAAMMSYANTAVALGIFVTMCSAMKNFRNIPRLNVLGRTFYNALPELVFFTLVLVVVMFSFATVFMMLFSASMESFKNWKSSVWTMFRSLGGDIPDVDTMVEQGGAVGQLIYIIYLFVIVFTVLSIVIGILTEAYEEVMAEDKEKSESVFDILGETLSNIKQGAEESGVVAGVGAIEAEAVEDNGDKEDKEDKPLQPQDQAGVGAGMSEEATTALLELVSTRVSGLLAEHETKMTQKMDEVMAAVSKIQMIQAHNAGDISADPGNGTD